MTVGDSELFQHIPLFDGLSSRRIANLSDAATLRRLDGETVLFREGRKPNHLHILVSGVVELFKEQGRRDYGILLMSSGDIFMPAAVLFHKRYLNSARTLTASKILLLPAAVVREEFSRSHQLSLNFSRVLAGQFRMATRHIIDLKCHSAAQRLAAFLLKLVDESPLQATARLAVQKRRLAARLGMTPETLSRTFQTLREHGLVVRGTEIIVRDRAKAEEFCGPVLYEKAHEAALNVHAR